MWSKNAPDGCLRCGQTEKPHNGRGYCGACYTHLRRSGELSLTHPKGGPFQIRGDEYRCTGCREWKKRDEYRNRHDLTPPIDRRCKTCRTAYWHSRRERYVELNRKRRRRETQQIRAADRRGQERLWVPVEPVLRWISVALRAGDTGNNLARRIGVNPRLLRTLKSQQRVGVDLAERIAHATGNEGELWVIPTGKPGWSTHSDYCLRCGTYGHPHYAKGYCRRCYNAVNAAKRAGRPVPLPSWEKWSRYHATCVRCHSCSSAHSARGLCARCLLKLKRDAKALGIDPYDHIEALGYTTTLMTTTYRRRIDAKSADRTV